MKQRIITGTLLVAVLAPLLIVPACKPIYEVLMVVMGIGAMYELIHMFDKEKKIPMVMRIIAVAVMLILYASFVNFIDQRGDTLIVKLLDHIVINPKLHVRVVVHEHTLAHIRHQVHELLLAAL